MSLDGHRGAINRSSAPGAFQRFQRGLERNGAPSDRGWLKRVHFSHLADPGRPVGSDRQSHGQNEVRIRISRMLGASPFGLIHSVAVRYSQI